LLPAVFGNKETKQVDTLSIGHLRIRHQVESRARTIETKGVCRVSSFGATIKLIKYLAHQLLRTAIDFDGITNLGIIGNLG